MQNAWAIRGAAGRLRAGSRPAASLGAWEAKHVDGQRWRFTFESYTPDPYWFEHGSSFKVTLSMGKSELRAPCEITSRDPLIIELEMPT